MSAHALQAPLAGRPAVNQPVWVWLALGLAGYVALPWYAQQDANGLTVLGQVFSQAQTGSGLMQAAAFGRPWLWLALLGLVIAGFGALLPAGRRQGGFLVLGGGLGLVSLLVSGFAIGARGWAFDWLNASVGELTMRQPGVGWGGFVVLTALLVLAAFGVARRGYFKGDLFVAAAVLGMGSLLALFIVFPVLKALSGAFFLEDGPFSLAVLWERVAHERNFGLACLAGGQRCGVAWNTLFLGLMTAASTTLLGTFMALMAERASRRYARPLNIVALLPIITPPFVVGLGLILLFGRAGVFNQFLEYAFGITPSRWFYGWLGVWVAQTFAFTPIAFMIMRGVVQGVAPSLEEAAQTLRASPHQTFMTVTLPLLKPGLANAFLVGFIESMADFGNPIVVGGQFSVLSTEIFFAIVGAQYDQGRSASLAWILTLFALAVFAIQRALLGRQNFTTVSGKGDAGIAMPLPTGVRRVVHSVALPWMAFTLIVYLFALAGGFVQTWGRDYTITLNHFRTAFNVEWGEFGMVWAGTAWNSFFTTIKLAALSAPLTATLGIGIAWLLARTEFRGQGLFEFSALLAFAIPGTVLGVSYILAFNVPPFELTGTALIIVLCFMFRNLPVGVRAGTAAFKQLDRSLDEASLMLRAGSVQTLRHVVMPLLKPALVAALVYSFVRAITTVSAVIFLVTAENELATTYIIGRVGNGDYGVALAYCTVLIVLMSLAIALIQWLVGERKLGRRSGAAAMPAPTEPMLNAERNDTMNNSGAGIVFRDITKRYGTDASAPLAVKGISFEVPRGTLTTILGPSGCGKTTTLRMIAGLESPTSGEIFIGGKDVTTLGPAQRNVSMMFQSYALFPHMNVVENVSYGLRMSGLAKDVARSKAVEALRGVGLVGFDDRLPSELSGGQQQRVALARALVLEPEVLLFDEPLSNLDARLRREMREEIRALQQRLSLTVAYVTHDQAEAMAVSDQIIVMDQGLIAQAGTPQALYETPRTEFVAGFMGEAMLFPGTALADGTVQLGPLALRPRTAAAPGPVKVAVRPEAWSIKRKGEGLLPATLRKRAYLGAVHEYTFDTPLGSIFVASSDLDDVLAVGDQVQLGLGVHGVSVVDSTGT